MPQEVPAQVEVRIAPFGAPVAPGDTVAAPVRVVYCYHALGSVASDPTRVTLTVPEAPAWTEAVVEPAELAFSTDPAPHLGFECQEDEVTLTLTVASKGVDANGSVHVVADAARNPPISSASGEDTVEVETAPGAGDDVATASGGGGPAAAIPFPALAGAALAAVAAAAFARRGRA